MNPLTNVKNIQKLNQRELELGVIGKKSWHDEYKDSAWVFIGGLPYDLTEGDIVCVFSQYGEVVNINLVRDKATGKSKGFAFLCYEDQRSTVLAVDNLNSIKVLGRIIRVDHVHDYKKPKERGTEDEETLKLRAEGCAPRAPQPTAALPDDLLDVPISIRPPPPATGKDKKAKKEKKKKKKKKKMKVTVKVERRSDSDSSSSESSDTEDDHRSQKRKHRYFPVNSDKLKQEKPDSGYDRALQGHRKHTSQEPDHDGGNRKHDHRDAAHKDRNGDRLRADSQDRRDRGKQSERDRHRDEDVKPERDPDKRSDYSNKARDKMEDHDRHEDDKPDRRRDDRDYHRSRDRDENRTRDGDREFDKQRDRDRGYDKQRDRDYDKQRDRDYDKQRDRHRGSSGDDRRDKHRDDYNKSRR